MSLRLAFIMGFLVVSSAFALPFNALRKQGRGECVNLSGIQVVIPSGGEAKESWAAEFLQKRLESGIGHKIPVVTDVHYRGQTPFISLGSTSLAKDLGLVYTGNDDGYVVSVRDGNLFLLGSQRRGPINAVLALLEEDLGWRWYSIFRPEVMPKLQDEITVVPRSHSPKFRMRDYLIWENRENLEFTACNRGVPIQKRLPVQFGPTHSYVPYLFCHTMTRSMSYFNRVEKMFEKHPEMYALRDGKRVLPPFNPCLTNSGVLDLLTENTLAAVRRDPNYEIVSVSQGDGRNIYCQCPACLREIEAYNYSGYVLRFVNKVAAKVAREYPHVLVSTLAYSDTADLPRGGVRPAANVAIQLTDDRYLEGWSKLSENIYLWYNWPACFKNLLLPMPGLPEIGEKIKMLSRNSSVKGVMFNGNYKSPGSSMASLLVWATLKMLWNPSWNVNDLIRDFCMGYYGEAAPDMMAYAHILYDSNMCATEDHECVWDKVSGCRSRIRFAPGMIHRMRNCLNEGKKKAAHDRSLVEEIEREELCVLFARLDGGILNNSDCDVYEADLVRFESLSRKFHVTHCSELERQMTVEKQIAQWKGNIEDYRVLYNLKKK